MSSHFPIGAHQPPSFVEPSHSESQTPGYFGPPSSNDNPFAPIKGPVSTMNQPRPTHSQQGSQHGGTVPGFYFTQSGNRSGSPSGFFDSFSTQGQQYIPPMMKEPIYPVSTVDQPHSNHETPVVISHGSDQPHTSLNTVNEYSKEEQVNTQFSSHSVCSQQPSQQSTVGLFSSNDFFSSFDTQSLPLLPSSPQPPHSIVKEKPTSAPSTTLVNVIHSGDEYSSRQWQNQASVVVPQSSGQFSLSKEPCPSQLTNYDSNIGLPSSVTNDVSGHPSLGSSHSRTSSLTNAERLIHSGPNSGASSGLPSPLSRPPSNADSQGRMISYSGTYKCSYQTNADLDFTSRKGPLTNLESDNLAVDRDVIPKVLEAKDEQGSSTTGEPDASVKQGFRIGGISERPSSCSSSLNQSLCSLLDNQEDFASRSSPIRLVAPAPFVHYSYPPVGPPASLIGEVQIEKMSDLSLLPPAPLLPSVNSETNVSGTSSIHTLVESDSDGHRSDVPESTVGRSLECIDGLQNRHGEVPREIEKLIVDASFKQSRKDEGSVSVSESLDSGLVVRGQGAVIKVTQSNSDRGEFSLNDWEIVESVPDKVSSAIGTNPIVSEVVPLPVPVTALTSSGNVFSEQSLPPNIGQAQFPSEHFFGPPDPRQQSLANSVAEVPPASIPQYSSASAVIHPPLNQSFIAYSVQSGVDATIGSINNPVPFIISQAPSMSISPVYHPGTTVYTSGSNLAVSVLEQKAIATTDPSLVGLHSQQVEASTNTVRSLSSINAVSTLSSISAVTTLSSINATGVPPVHPPLQKLGHHQVSTSSPSVGQPHGLVARGQTTNSSSYLEQVSGNSKDQHVVTTEVKHQTLSQITQDSQAWIVRSLSQTISPPSMPLPQSSTLQQSQKSVMNPEPSLNAPPPQTSLVNASPLPIAAVTAISNPAATASSASALNTVNPTSGIADSLPLKPQISSTLSVDQNQPVEKYLPEQQKSEISVSRDTSIIPPAQLTSTTDVGKSESPLIPGLSTDVPSTESQHHAQKVSESEEPIGDRIQHEAHGTTSADTPWRSQHDMDYAGGRHQDPYYGDVGYRYDGYRQAYADPYHPRPYTMVANDYHDKYRAHDYRDRHHHPYYPGPHGYDPYSHYPPAYPYRLHGEPHPYDAYGHSHDMRGAPYYHRYPPGPHLEYPPIHPGHPGYRNPTPHHFPPHSRYHPPHSALPGYDHGSHLYGGDSLGYDVYPQDADDYHHSQTRHQSVDQRSEIDTGTEPSIIYGAGERNVEISQIYDSPNSRMPSHPQMAPLESTCLEEPEVPLHLQPRDPGFQSHEFYPQHQDNQDTYFQGEYTDYNVDPSAYDENSYYYENTNLWEPVAATPPPPSRETPEFFSYPHVHVTFGFGGQLVIVLPNNVCAREPAVVEIGLVRDLLEDEESTKFVQEVMESSRPFIPKETPKNLVVNFAANQAKLCGERKDALVKSEGALSSENSMSAELFEDEALLWKYLMLLCQQNGVMVPTDVADLLMNDCPLSIKSSTHFGVQDQQESLDSLRQLLLSGRRKDALDYACSKSLWGHALMLASRMDEQNRTYVVNRFTASLMTTDPLSTFYTLLLGRTPSSVKPEGLSRAGDWRPHLSMILANKSATKLDNASIVSLGDSLMARKRLHAAHLCYNLADVHFGCYGNTNTRFSLLGVDHTEMKAGTYPKPQDLEKMEVYEFAMNLMKQDHSLPAFQVFKLLYVFKLVEYGFLKKALRYCEQISHSVVKGMHKYVPTFLASLVEISIRLHHFITDLGIVENELPSWLCYLQQSVTNILSTDYTPNVLSPSPTFSSVSQTYSSGNGIQPRPIIGLQQDSVHLTVPQPLFTCMKDSSVTTSKEGSVQGEDVPIDNEVTTGLECYFNQTQPIAVVPSTEPSNYSEVMGASKQQQQQQQKQQHEPQGNVLMGNQQLFSQYGSDSSGGQIPMLNPGSDGGQIPILNPGSDGGQIPMLNPGSDGGQIPMFNPGSNGGQIPMFNPGSDGGQIPMFNPPSQDGDGGQVSIFNPASQDGYGSQLPTLNSTSQDRESRVNSGVQQVESVITDMQAEKTTVAGVGGGLDYYQQQQNIPNYSISSSVPSQPGYFNIGYGLNQGPSQEPNATTTAAAAAELSSSGPSPLSDDPQGSGHNEAMPIGSNIQTSGDDHVTKSEPNKVDGEKETKDKSAKTKASGGSGWGFGLLQYIIPKKKNQAHLPDDKSPKIVWDKEKNKWVNMDDDGKEEEESAPPPTDAELNRSLPQQTRPSTGGAEVTDGGSNPPESEGEKPVAGGQMNMYSRQSIKKGLGARSKYVDILNPGGTSSGSLPPPGPPPMGGTLGATPFSGTFFMPPSTQDEVSTQPVIESMSADSVVTAATTNSSQQANEQNLALEHNYLPGNPLPNSEGRNQSNQTTYSPEQYPNQISYNPSDFVSVIDSQEQRTLPQQTLQAYQHSQPLQQQQQGDYLGQHNLNTASQQNHDRMRSQRAPNQGQTQQVTDSTSMEASQQPSAQQPPIQHPPVQQPPGEQQQPPAQQPQFFNPSAFAPVGQFPVSSESQDDAMSTVSLMSESSQEVSRYMGRSSAGYNRLRQGIRGTGGYLPMTQGVASQQRPHPVGQGTAPPLGHAHTGTTSSFYRK